MSFLNWWQNLPLGFDGVLLSIGSFDIQYYGLMYMVGFGICYFLVKHRMDREEQKFVSDKDIEDLFFGLILMVILGGRLGYVLFYNFEYYLMNPVQIIWPFSGGDFVGISGMSFHGGLLACILYGWYFLKKREVDFWKVSDLIISVAPLGYFFGRIGNFLNNELYGRVTDSPFGMKFQDFPQELRYPSQLFQGVLEGLILFGLLSFMYKKKLANGLLVPVALVWFGCARFGLEFFREPDTHLGLYMGLSRGQFLSGLLIFIGAGIGVFRSRKGS